MVKRNNLGSEPVLMVMYQHDSNAPLPRLTGVDIFLFVFFYKYLGFRDLHASGPKQFASHKSSQTGGRKTNNDPSGTSLSACLLSTLSPN